MPKLYLSEALGLLGKTLPFVWVRLGSYVVLFAGLAVYFAVVGGLAWLLGACGRRSASSSSWSPSAAASGWCAGSRATTSTCSRRRTWRS